MLEQGAKVDHPTIYSWMQAYRLGLDKRCPYLEATNDLRRVDEIPCRDLLKNKIKVEVPLSR